MAEDLDDYAAAYAIGEKVLEMADRLSPVDRVVPGSRANWALEVDGVRYSLVMSVEARDGTD